MGSYAHCWLDDLLIGTSKNGVYSDLISLFRERDKLVLSPPFHDLPYHLRQYLDEPEEDPDFQLICYQAPVHEVRDRLNVLGYTLENAEEGFRAWTNSEIAESRSRLEELSYQDSKHREMMCEMYEEKIKFLTEMHPDAWVENIRTIRDSSLSPNQYGKYEGPHEESVIGYMLSNEWYGFPGHDMLIPLRLAIEACDGGESLFYDLTDIVWSGYFDIDTSFVEHGAELSAAEYSSVAKTIILTEGKSDAWALREVLDFLYPHVSDYFSILDFESTGYGGGVGNLANVVKAFAGAGIVNNVIALFDNDTAAIAACKKLSEATIPNNIRIVRLPAVSLLDHYPTIGPTGNVDMNVNGMAASLELYFGEDVLRNSDGDLCPVLWTGYERSLRKYQGEVSDKTTLHDKFREKLARRPQSSDPAWREMHALLGSIFAAFDEKKKELIVGRAKEFIV